MATARTSLFRLLQAAFLAAVLWFAGRALAGQWEAVRSAAAHADPHWGVIALSSAIVLVTYVLLIETWRVTVLSWGTGGLDFPFAAAARIWFVSSLGRYLPGKLWQFGTIAVMAQRRGISAVAAAGASLLVTVVNTVAGFVVLAATGTRVLTVPPAAVVVLAAVGICVALLPWILPHLIELATRVTGREIPAVRIASRTVWLAAGASVIAWILYGLAFHLLSIGILGHATGAPALSIAIFTGSYLAGFLTLIAPGGLIVREGVMFAALAGAGVGAGPAALLVVASRLWLTVLEILPPLLLLTRTEEHVRNNA